MITVLAYPLQVRVLAAVAGEDLVAEAREVKFSSNPDRPPLVKVVYAGSRTSAWITVERIVHLVDQARLIDIANGARQCVHCGCTDNVACDGGCAWAREGCCTSCAAKERAA